MKKVITLALLGILSLSLLTGAMAETAAPVAETAAPVAETAAPVVETAQTPALDAAELDALLALKLESGKTFSQALEELGILDAFKAALPREQLRMIQAQLLLGKLTRADVLLLRETLVTAFIGDASGAGFRNGRNFNDGMNRGGRDKRQQGNQGGMMGRRGGMMDRQGGMMGGRNGMMQPGQGRGPVQGGMLCPNCQNCPYAQTTPKTAPEATVTP